MDLKRISCRIEWSLFQVYNPKHMRVIIYVQKILFIKDNIVAFSIKHMYFLFQLHQYQYIYVARTLTLNTIQQLQRLCTSYLKLTNLCTFTYIGSSDSNSTSVASPDHESDSDSKESLRRSVENLFNLRYGIHWLLYQSLCVSAKWNNWTIHSEW